MKKLLFILILTVILNTGVFGQEEENITPERKFTIQTSPLFLGLSILAGEILSISEVTNSMFLILDLEGQYKISDMNNISLTLSFLIDNDEYSNSYLLSLKPMYIIRPFRTGLKGFYVGLYPTVGWYSEENKYEDNINSFVIGFGINTGYKWIFKRGFTIQAGLKFEKSWYIPESIPSSESTNVFVRLLNYSIIDFKLGYSF